MIFDRTNKPSQKTRIPTKALNLSTDNSFLDCLRSSHTLYCKLPIANCEPSTALGDARKITLHFVPLLGVRQSKKIIPLEDLQEKA